MAERQGEISGLQVKALTALGINVQRSLEPEEAEKNHAELS